MKTRITEGQSWKGLAPPCADGETEALGRGLLAVSAAVCQHLPWPGPRHAGSGQHSVPHGKTLLKKCGALFLLVKQLRHPDGNLEPAERPGPPHSSPLPPHRVRPGRPRDCPDASCPCFPNGKCQGHRGWGPGVPRQRQGLHSLAGGAAGRGLGRQEPRLLPQAQGRPTPCWGWTRSPASTCAPSQTSSGPSRRPVTARTTACPCRTSR